MNGSGFIGTLGLVTGVLFILLGIVFLVAGPLITNPLDSMLDSSARGLRTSGEAISSVTNGVSNSSGMIEDVRVSLETSSEALTGTGDVIQQTVEILEETRIIIPALANDMSSMPPMVRNLMPGNHFNEIAERTETVAVKLGLLNTQLESLSGDVLSTSEAVSGVALSVETLKDDLLSAEGSFSEAAEKMEETADFLEKSSFAGTVAVLFMGIGILMLLTGLYQVSSAVTISRLMKKLGNQ